MKHHLTHSYDCLWYMVLRGNEIITKILKKEQKVPLQSSKGRNNKFKKVEMKTDG